MKQKSELDMEVAATSKAVRSAIRLKHSTKADREINDKLPGIVAEINDAFAEGRPYKPNLAAILED